MIRSEKLSQELLWLADKLFHYGGGSEVLRLWASAPGLAESARTAGPRVQANLVKLSALLVRSMAGTEWTVTAVISRDSLNGPVLQTIPFSLASDPALSYRASGYPAAIPTVPRPPLATQSWAPPDLQYRLLLQWLPLMCRAIHAGTGPSCRRSRSRCVGPLHCAVLCCIILCCTVVCCSVLYCTKGGRGPAAERSTSEQRRIRAGHHSFGCLFASPSLPTFPTIPMSSFTLASVCV